MPHRDTGWTMDRFIEYVFGPERVFAVVTLVEDAQRLTERLVETPADERLRRALRRQLCGLRDSADANRWLQEGDIAAGLTDLPIAPNDVGLSVHGVQVGLQALQRLVQHRLARVIALNRLAAA